MIKQGLLPISAAAVNCIPMFSRLREIIRQALWNGEKTGFIISVPSVGNGLNNLEFALKEETILKRLLQKGIALWLALALAASMLPAGFAAATVRPLRAQGLPKAQKKWTIRTFPMNMNWMKTATPR